jgi:4-hydroxy-3-methylbut-2-enyl diphosphate reductase
VHGAKCPHVHRAHEALRELVALGYAPVVIGQNEHVEVRGLIGDYPQAYVIETERDIDEIPNRPAYGAVSQTTQVSERVAALVQKLRETHADSIVLFHDTVYRPTKERQSALSALVQEVDAILVIGGKHSNNTCQLLLKAQSYGLPAWSAQNASEIDYCWFHGIDRLGITAGTSTPDEDIEAAIQAIETYIASRGLSQAA